MWNADLYDQKHNYVSEYGESLIDWLCPLKDEVIFDIGCGTGDLTSKISEAGATVIGIDSSISMIEQAKSKYPKIEFQVQDAEAFSRHNEFDAVFSNATLHWIRKPEKVASSIFHSLKPGGRFVAEFGGQDNVKLIINGIYRALDEFDLPQNQQKNPWWFPSVGEYTSILEQQNFTIRDVTYYNRPVILDEGEKGLKNWIDMFAFFFFENIPSERYTKIIAYIEDLLRPFLFKDGSWTADYKRLRIKAEKPGN